MPDDLRRQEITFAKYVNIQFRMPAEPVDLPMWLDADVGTAHDCQRIRVHRFREFRQVEAATLLAIGIGL